MGITSPALSLSLPICKMGQECGLCGLVTEMKLGKEIPGQATAGPCSPEGRAGLPGSCPGTGQHRPGLQSLRAACRSETCTSRDLPLCPRVPWAGHASQVPGSCYLDPKFPSHNSWLGGLYTPPRHECKQAPSPPGAASMKLQLRPNFQPRPGCPGCPKEHLYSQQRTSP